MRRECDFCKENGKSNSAIVDRQTKMRYWAYMCQVHNALYGIGKATVLAELGDY